MQIIGPGASKTVVIVDLGDSKSSTIYLKCPKLRFINYFNPFKLKKNKPQKFNINGLKNNLFRQKKIFQKNFKIKNNKDFRINNNNNNGFCNNIKFKKISNM